MTDGGDPLSSDYPVRSVQDLIAVLTHLRSDLDENPDHWENPSLDRFLRALAAWLSAFPRSYVKHDSRSPSRTGGLSPTVFEPRSGQVS